MPLRENELSWPWSRRALQHAAVGCKCVFFWYLHYKALAKQIRVVSGRKLKIWFYLRLRLARPCVQLRWLAMTCAPFGRDQICTQVKASFSVFGHPTEVNASWMTSIYLLLASQIENSLPKNIFFVTCVYLRGNLRVRLATQRKSLRKLNLNPFATTCRSVWPGLNGALNKHETAKPW